MEVGWSAVVGEVVMLDRVRLGGVDRLGGMVGWME